VALTNGEQRRLKAIESVLTSESPELAALLSSQADVERRRRRRVRLHRLVVLAGALLGLAATIVGGVFDATIVTELGLVVIIGCLLDLSLTAWKARRTRPARRQ
jgi:Protein of unknown function (DUF3040)